MFIRTSVVKNGKPLCIRVLTPYFSYESDTLELRLTSFAYDTVRKDDIIDLHIDFYGSITNDVICGMSLTVKVLQSKDAKHLRCEILDSCA